MATMVQPAGTTRPLFFDVDKTRLLGESRRFFVSSTDALTELVQNAHRAGARHLTVTADRTARVITFVDNGPGLADPSALVTFAGSQWRNDAFIEPAGVGFFAALGVASDVHVRSVYHGDAGKAAWSLAISRQVLDGGLAGLPMEVVDEASVAHETPCGLSVTLTLREDATWPELRPERLTWRHLFPLSMTLTLDGVTTELAAPKAPVARWFKTPVGRLGLVTDMRAWYAMRGEVDLQFRRYGDRMLVPVWESRFMASGERMETVLDGVRDPRLKALATAIAKADVFFLWEVDGAASGVRPQLPDRNRLLEDTALTAAFAAIRDHLLTACDVEHLTQLFVRIAGDTAILCRKEFRARIERDAVAQARVLFSAIALTTIEPTAFLATAGYEVMSRVSTPAESNPNPEDDSDGTWWTLESDSCYEDAFVRPAAWMADSAMLRNLGDAVSEPSDTQPATWRLAWDEARWMPEVALVAATNLRVVTMDGSVVRSLSAFWAGRNDEGLDESHTASLVAAGVVPDGETVYGFVAVADFSDAAAHLLDNADFEPLSLLASRDVEPRDGFDVGDYVSGSHGDWTLDYAAWARSMAVYVGELFGGPGLSQARQVLTLANVREAYALPYWHGRPRLLGEAIEVGLPAPLIAAIQSFDKAHAELETAIKAEETRLKA